MRDFSAVELISVLIAFVSLTVAALQMRSQQRQVALLIKERNDSHNEKELEDQKRVLEYEKKISVLAERVSNISAQVGELKNEVRDAFRELHARLKSE